MDGVQGDRGELALDAASLALWEKARRAWDVFAATDASYAGDAYRGGSMRLAQEHWITAARDRERVEVLRALLTPAPPPAKAEADLARMEHRALAEARDADDRKLAEDAQAAWKAYRTAELALVRRAYGSRYGGAEAAARAASAELARRRAQGLGGVLKAMHGG